MKKTFLTSLVNALELSLSRGFFAAPERTVFLFKYVSFPVRR
jgi:hypothetical protein